MECYGNALLGHGPYWSQIRSTKVCASWTLRSKRLTVISVNMIPKQREMDHIVQTIFKAIESKPHLESTLLVLCGDHGMNDGGNHGGSAPGETSPTLALISPKFQQTFSGVTCPTTPSRDFHYYDMVEQSDIAPTLAALLGFPIPKNNLGVLIPAFLPMWSSSKFFAF